MQVYTTDTSTVRSDRIKVGIADFAASSGESTPTMSGFGSCIGVALCDPETDISGLAHAMLLETGDDNEPAKFVDTSVELLIAEMQVVGADADRVIAKIAGGSMMFDFTSVDGNGSVGDRNVAATRTTLDGFGVDAVAEDVDGFHGRSLELDSETGDFRVRSTKSGIHVP